MLFMILIVPITGRQIDTTALANEYYARMKNPYVALALSGLIPSAGHYYAENWSRGIVLGSVRIVLNFLAFDFLISELAWAKETNENLNKFYLLTISGFAVTVFELIDSNREAGRYNQKVAEEIFGVPVEIRKNYLLYIDNKLIPPPGFDRSPGLLYNAPPVN